MEEEMATLQSILDRQSVAIISPAGEGKTAELSALQERLRGTCAEIGVRAGVGVEYEIINQRLICKPTPFYGAIKYFQDFATMNWSTLDNDMALIKGK
jgi:hypothetical protein